MQVRVDVAIEDLMGCEAQKQCTHVHLSPGAFLSGRKAVVRSQPCLDASVRFYVLRCKYPRSCMKGSNTTTHAVRGRLRSQGMAWLRPTLSTAIRGWKPGLDHGAEAGSQAMLAARFRAHTTSAMTLGLFLTGIWFYVRTAQVVCDDG